MSTENLQSSLTTPEDRTEDMKNTFNTSSPPLTDEQTTEALRSLNVDDFTKRFPKVERRFADPPIDLQKIGLISFVPAKGATPNEKGIFGFAKLRGNFATEVEASQRAETLIRTVDSYHQIYHTYVGRPFPITTSSDFSKEISQVDLQRQTAEAYSEDVKKKREKEQKDIEEIQQREKNLLEEVKRPEEPTDDVYTTLRVKKAQLMWTYSENTKRLKEIVGHIAKARYEIERLDRDHPELKDNYMNKYMEARRQAGLPTDKKSVDGGFMRYLAEDLQIPEVDEEYNRIYGDH